MIGGAAFVTFHGQGDIAAVVSSVAGVRPGVLGEQVVDPELFRRPGLPQVVLGTRFNGGAVPGPADRGLGVGDGARQGDGFAL